MFIFDTHRCTLNKCARRSEDDRAYCELITSSNGVESDFAKEPSSTQLTLFEY